MEAPYKPIPITPDDVILRLARPLQAFLRVAFLQCLGERLKKANDLICKLIDGHFGLGLDLGDPRSRFPEKHTLLFGKVASEHVDLFIGLPIGIDRVLE